MSDRLTVENIREALKKVEEETGSAQIPIFHISRKGEVTVLPRHSGETK